MKIIDKQFKKTFKRLKKQQIKVDQKWLLSVKLELKNFVSQKPYPSKVKSIQTKKPVQQIQKPNQFRYAYAIVGVVLVVALISGGGLMASPGDILYPLKITTQKLVVALNIPSKIKAKLHLNYASQRLDELEDVIINSQSLQKQVTQDFDSCMDQADKHLAKLSQPKDYIQTALDYGQAVESQTKKIQQIEEKLTNSAAPIIQQVEQTNQASQQKAIQVLEKAEQLLPVDNQQDNLIQQEIESKLESLEKESKPKKPATTGSSGVYFGGGSSQPTHPAPTPADNAVSMEPPSVDQDTNPTPELIDQNTNELDSPDSQFESAKDIAEPAPDVSQDNPVETKNQNNSDTPTVEEDQIAQAEPDMVLTDTPAPADTSAPITTAPIVVYQDAEPVASDAVSQPVSTDSASDSTPTSTSEIIETDPVPKTPTSTPEVIEDIEGEEEDGQSDQDSQLSEDNQPSGNEQSPSGDQSSDDNQEPANDQQLIEDNQQPNQEEQSGPT